MTGWKKRKIADAQYEIHSCGPFCDRPVCVAVRFAVEAEREACAKVCDALHYEVDAYGAQCAAAIRARGQA